MISHKWKLAFLTLLYCMFMVTFTVNNFNLSIKNNFNITSNSKNLCSNTTIILPFNITANIPSCDSNGDESSNHSVYGDSNDFIPPFKSFEKRFRVSLLQYC